MKKQELIHLHGLLAQVQNHYEEQTGEEVEHDRYTKLGVQPTSIHKSKTDHKDAVFALAEGITTYMQDGDEEEVITDGGYDEGALEDAYKCLEEIAQGVEGVQESHQVL